MLSGIESVTRQMPTTMPQNLMTKQSLCATKHKCWWHKNTVIIYISYILTELLLVIVGSVAGKRMHFMAWNNFSINQYVTLNKSLILHFNPYNKNLCKGIYYLAQGHSRNAINQINNTSKFIVIRQIDLIDACMNTSILKTITWPLFLKHWLIKNAWKIYENCKKKKGSESMIVTALGGHKPAPRHNISTIAL